MNPLTLCTPNFLYKQYYPSSNQFRDPPTYTHQPSMQQKVPFSLISCSSSKVAFCSCVEWGWHIYNIVESESDPLTRRAVDLFEKEPLKGNSEVHLHTPTKFGEDRSKDLGGDREQTDRQTNRQTDKRCSIYSMIWLTINKLLLTIFPRLTWYALPACYSKSESLNREEQRKSGGRVYYSPKGVATSDAQLADYTFHKTHKHWQDPLEKFVLQRSLVLLYMVAEQFFKLLQKSYSNE